MPSRRAASSKTSGRGLPCGTSSAETTTPMPGRSPTVSSRVRRIPGEEPEDVSLRVAELRLAESVTRVARRLQLHARKIEGGDVRKLGVHVVDCERQVTRCRSAAFEETRVAGAFEELERNAVAGEEHGAQAGRVLAHVAISRREAERGPVEQLFGEEIQHFDADVVELHSRLLRCGNRLSDTV